MMFSKISARTRSALARVAIAALVLAANPAALAQDIETYAGGGNATADGSHRLELKLESPTAIVLKESDVYIADAGRIRRIGADGIATTVAGTGVPGYSGDGGPALSAQVGRVSAMAFAPDGSLWFGESDNFRVRRIGIDGIVTTVAGNGAGPDAGLNGVATTLQLGTIRGLAIDSQGVAYIGTANIVRRLNPNGVTLSIAGSTPCSRNNYGDGSGAWARCYRGIGAVVVEDDEVRFVEHVENRVWRIDHRGLLRNVARNLLADGVTLGPVREITGLAIDPYNRAYVAHRMNPGVHRYDTPLGPIPVAGTGTAGYSGDGGPATSAALNEPGGMAIGNGRIFIVDTGNHRVRSLPMPTLAVPSRPPVPRVLAGSREAYLWIRPPALPGSSPITGYTVEALEIDTGAVSIIDADAGTTELNRVITGLEYNGLYYYRVIAHNAHGQSAPSAYTRQVEGAGFVQALVPEQVFIEEGDSGTRDAIFEITLPHDLPKDVTWEADLRTIIGVERGVDFEAATPFRVTIPAGATKGSYSVKVFGDTDFEGQERVRFWYRLLGGPAVMLTSHSDLVIVDDDPEPPPLVLPGTVADRYTVLENAGTTELAVLGNDAIDPELLLSGLALSSPPLLGTVSMDDRGTPARDDDVLRYTPAADRSGEDVFAYRLCYADGCTEAVVTVMLRPMADLLVTARARSGHVDLPLASTRDRLATSHAATPLVRPLPATDYSSFSIRQPPEETRRDWRILVESIGEGDAPDFDVLIGVDDDGDYVNDPEEVRCHAAMGGRRQRCEITATVPTNAPFNYWVRTVNRGSNYVHTRVFEVPMIGNDGKLSASAPAVLDRGEAYALRVGWNEPGVVDGDFRAGYVRVQEGNEPATWVPVVLEFEQPELTPISLVPGNQYWLERTNGRWDTRVFVDVPEGATRLQVRASSANGSNVYLVKGDEGDRARSVIAPSPSVTGAATMAIGTTEQKLLEVSAPQLTPGRWYVVTYARESAYAGGRNPIGLTATIDAAAPVVRPGSYFNAGRPGHGLLVYPAGGQWAGLWYTYFEDGTPTWYYLQAPAPGIDGIWAAKLFRSTWLGDHNKLEQVGEAVATPTGPDAFLFSYMVDGRTGSEPLAALGRGCPTLSGLPLDASSHWFDPARAGSGYSVQLWPNYEFHAAFLYDERGVARFLTAESPRFAGADASLVLEQLRGFCPTCTAVVPTRQPVGTLRRVFANAGLSRMQVDTMFEAPLSGDWTSDDLVQLLGGAGTAQGCEP